MNTFKKCLIFLTFTVYGFQLVINSYAGRGKIFPNSIGNVSRIFHLEITPAPQTFAIWGIIYLLQLFWLSYAIITVFRSSPAADILSSGFYTAFIFNIMFVVVWDFAWTHENIILSFSSLFTGQIFISIACGLACYDLKVFLVKNKSYKRNSVDVVIHRILIQNGLLFYATWALIATLINCAIIMVYMFHISQRVAGSITLIILGVLIIIWAIMENLIYSRYTVATVSPYIVVMIGLAGIIGSKHYIHEVVAAIACVLLAMTVLCFVFRCLIIYIHLKKDAVKKEEQDKKCRVLLE